MRRYFLLIALFLTLSVSMPVFSATEQNSTGKIIMIDPRLHIFILKEKQSERVFEVSPRSLIVIDGERKLLGELEKGEIVSVRYKLQ